MASNAEERAAVGFYEHTGADGAAIQVQQAEGSVTVFQHSASAFGRGAAVLTPDEADALAAGITAAAAAARDEGKEEAAEAPAVVDASAVAPVNEQVLPPA